MFKDDPVDPSAPVNPSTASPAPPPPFKRSPIDKYTLNDAWSRFTADVEIPGINPLEWGMPDGRDFIGLLDETQDSVEFACDKAADHTFRLGDDTGVIPRGPT